MASRRAGMAHGIWAYSVLGLVTNEYRARTRAWDYDTRSHTRDVLRMHVYT